MSARKLIPLFCIAILILAIAGCTTNSVEKAAAPLTGGKSAEKAATGETATTATESSTAGQTGQGTTPKAPMMIKTADMTIEVGKGEFEKKYEAVKQVADDFDGYVTNTSASKTGTEIISGTVTIRVPAKEFDNAIAAVKKIGKTTNIQVKGDDVTEEYVDLESRLKNYQAQEAQLLAIMQKAQTVDETLKVQEQLTAVQGEMEVIKGRMTYLDNRVDLSTITVTVQEPGAVVPESDEWGIMDALRTSVEAFFIVVNVLIVLIGALLPAVIITAVVFFIVRWRSKRKKQKKES